MKSGLRSTTNASDELFTRFVCTRDPHPRSCCDSPQWMDALEVDTVDTINGQLYQSMLLSRTAWNSCANFQMFSVSRSSGIWMDWLLDSMINLRLWFRFHLFITVVAIWFVISPWRFVANGPLEGRQKLRLLVSLLHFLCRGLAKLFERQCLLQMFK